MSGLFRDKRREEREDKYSKTQGREQQKLTELQGEKAEAASQYDGMITRALERLTRWAFPDSQVEREADVKWQLWHTADDGEKYVDVAVELYFQKGRLKAFTCDGPLQVTTAELTREALDDALRECVCSRMWD